MVGGVLGYFALGQVGGLLPFVLAIAASNFMYIALSDLIPQLHAQADGSGSHRHAHSHAVPRSQAQAASAHGDAHPSHDHPGHGDPYEAYEAHEANEDYEGQASEHHEHHNAEPHTATGSASWLQPLLMLAGVGLAYLATSLLHSH